MARRETRDSEGLLSLFLPYIREKERENVRSRVRISLIPRGGGGNITEEGEGEGRPFVIVGRRLRRPSRDANFL